MDYIRYSMKYIIINFNFVEFPILFPDVVNHNEMIPSEAEVISGGKWRINIDHEVCVQMGSLSLKIDRDPEREKKDLWMIKKMLNS